jgi:peptide/nickel transport system substrate-binding protein
MVAMRRRDFARGALAIGALSWLPTTKAAFADPKKGGVLAYATVSGPGGLDPHVSSSAVELEVIHNVFEPLVSLDNQNATKTMLATSATASADAKTYTFVSSTMATR